MRWKSCTSRRGEEGHEPGVIDAGSYVLMGTRTTAHGSESTSNFCVGSITTANEHTGRTSGSQTGWAKIIVDSETRVGGKEGER